MSAFKNPINNKDNLGSIVEPLTSKNTYNHPDPLIKAYTRGRLMAHFPENKDGVYISIPLASGSYINGDINTNYSMRVLLAYIMKSFGSKGSSVLLKAPPGAGKTYNMIEYIAPILGEYCNTEVYMVMPITPTVAQQYADHGCDVRYGSVKIQEPGSNPNIRCYIYDDVHEIHEITDIRTAGVDHPVILIIDEAHSLITETIYRGSTLDQIITKAREILESGGIVIAMTASTDTISATIPYNSRSGYDVICHLFGVSSNNALITDDGVISYPNYGYSDVCKYGQISGVELTSPIPTERLRVIYPHMGQKIVEAMLATIEDLLSQNRKIIVEYNDIATILKIKRTLKDLGYHTEVCCGRDKHFTFDAEEKLIIYDNPVLDTIINRRAIDTDAVDVILTTKLLENGTTINNIMNGDPETIEKVKNSITTIFVVKDRNAMDLESVTQFSSRVRFNHTEAIIICEAPLGSENNRKKADVNFFNEKEIGKVIDFIDLLREDSIPDSRLANLDLRRKEDLPLSISPRRIVDAETISRTIREAQKKYYRYLMYNRELFEKEIRECYKGKDIVFEEAKDTNIIISKDHPRLTSGELESFRKIIKQSFCDTAIRDAYKDGMNVYYEKGLAQVLPEHTVLLNFARPDYIDMITHTTGIVFSLQDISRIYQDKEIIPGFLSEEHYADTITRVVAETSSDNLKKLYYDSVQLGFTFLSRYKSVYKVIMLYALKYRTIEYRHIIDKTVAVCEAVLTDLDTELKGNVKKLIKRLLLSPVKEPLDRLISISQLVTTIDIDYYIRLTGYPVRYIEDLTYVMQVSTFVMFPGLSLEAVSDAGATYRAITSARTFEAATGRVYDTAKELKNWEGVTLKKDTADVIYSEAIKILKQNHKPFNSNLSEGRLAVLRLFATAFTYTIKEYTEKSTRAPKTKKLRKFILRALRTKIPKDYDEIIGLTFRYKKIDA